MFEGKSKGKEYYKNKIFVGIVEKNIDESRIGRIKVRVQGVFDNIELEHIPWASPFKSLDGRSFGVPGIGKIVNVIFPQGNIYAPEYTYSEKYNINLNNKLNDLEDEEYKNFVALLFDHRTQIFADDESLTLDYYFNQIKIKNNKINLELKNNNQKINLGHDDANQDAVLGTNFFEWFDKFMNTLLQPTSLVGNMSAPILKPQIDQLITEYKSIRPTFVSNNVKINDNHQIEQKLDREIGTQSMVNDNFTVNETDVFGDGGQSIQTPIEKELGDKVINENEEEIKNTRNNSAEAPDIEAMSDDYNLIIGEIMTKDE